MLVIYLIFALFWINSFLDYLCQFIINVATCSYYFDSTKDKEGNASITLGFKSAFYHVGSIAFGSFFIASLRIVVYFISFINSLGFSVCGSFFQILDESTLAFQAATGDSFCESANSMAELKQN